jgi:rubrerythrin
VYNYITDVEGYLLQRRERTLQNFIEVSMQVEANALDLYNRMRRVIKNDDAEKVFSSFIGEEKVRLARLGGLLGKKLEERRGKRHAGEEETQENH